MFDDLKEALIPMLKVLLSLLSGFISGLKDILGDTEPIPTVNP